MAVDPARAKSLFLSVSEIAEPAKRAAFLDRECGEDAELRGRVEALLRANDAAPLPPAEAGDRTSEYVPDPLSETDDHGDPTARVGAILAGKYKLIEEIGEGGMGSVYLAQQTEPVKRAVAVKVIKAGMDSKAVLVRFEAERQALADEVVEARPPSAGYRFQKFVRRHRGQVLAASLILVVLLAGIAGTTWGMVRAAERAEGERRARIDAQKAAEAERQAKLLADHKRREAERNLEYARKGNAILGSVFEGLDPKRNYASVAELRNALRDNLQRAVTELEGSAIGEPLEVALMQSTLGVSLRWLGETRTAIEVFQKAGKVFESELGTDHPETLANMNNLAGSYQDLGQLDKAIPMLEAALRGRKAVLGADHELTLLSMSNLGNAQVAARQLDKAEPLLQEALALLRSKQGADHKATLACMNNLALCYGYAGQHAKALPLFEEALRRKKTVLGESHYNTLHGMNNLASCYWVLKQSDKAIALLEETVQLQRSNLGPDHPTTLSCMANLGVMYKDTGRPEAAISLLEEPFQARIKHPTFRYIGLPLLDAYVLAGKREPAVTAVQQLLVDFRKELPEASPQLAERLAAFGMALLRVKAFNVAEPLLRECLAIRTQTRPDDRQIFNTQSMLGGALLGQNKYAEAEPLLMAGYEGMKKREKTIPPEASTRIPEVLDRLIELYTATNKPDEVKKWQEERAKYPSVAKQPLEQK